MHTTPASLEFQSGVCEVCVRRWKLRDVRAVSGAGAGERRRKSDRVVDEGRAARQRGCKVQPRSLHARVVVDDGCRCHDEGWRVEGGDDGVRCRMMMSGVLALIMSASEVLSVMMRLCLCLCSCLSGSGSGSGSGFGSVC
eukprot:1885744-Rhodomonas_salina.1